VPEGLGDHEADGNASAYYDEQHKRADLLRRTPIQSEDEVGLRKEREKYD